MKKFFLALPLLLPLALDSCGRSFKGEFHEIRVNLDKITQIQVEQSNLYNEVVRLSNDVAIGSMPESHDTSMLEGIKKEYDKLLNDANSGKNTLSREQKDELERNRREIIRQIEHFSATGEDFLQEMKSKKEIIKIKEAKLAEINSKREDVVLTNKIKSIIDKMKSDGYPKADELKSYVIIGNSGAIKLLENE